MGTSKSTSNSKFKMPLSVSLKLDRWPSRINEIFPDTIELLANDGKVTANRGLLRIASSAINTTLLESPTNVLDFKYTKKATIDSILDLIYNGKTTFKDKVEKQEVTSLAQELGIDIIELAENIKVDAPTVPEDQSKNEDPGLFPLKDGRFSCGLCFKAFPRKGDAKRHYQIIHMSKEKNISCRVPKCDKKFTNMY